MIFRIIKYCIIEKSPREYKMHSINPTYRFSTVKFVLTLKRKKPLTSKVSSFSRYSMALRKLQITLLITRI